MRWGTSMQVVKHFIGFCTLEGTLPCFNKWKETLGDTLQCCRKWGCWRCYSTPFFFCIIFYFTAMAVALHYHHERAIQSLCANKNWQSDITYRLYPHQFLYLETKAKCQQKWKDTDYLLDNKYVVDFTYLIWLTTTCTLVSISSTLVTIFCHNFAWMELISKQAMKEDDVHILNPDFYVFKPGSDYKIFLSVKIFTV